MSEKKDVLEEFVLNVGSMFGTLNCIRIASGWDGFTVWLKQEHEIDDYDKLFEGYKFFLESAVRSFLNTLTIELSLDIKEDFVFHRARFAGIPLNKVPNTCEKTIFVKHIINQLREISKAKNVNEMKLALTHFKSRVLDTFDDIFKKDVLVGEGMDLNKEEALRYVTMFYTYIYLNDTSRYRPHGYWVGILGNSINEEQHTKSFLGYKYTLQFMWSQLLGKKYHSTSLVNLHKSNDWSSMGVEQKPHDERDDLDSYFVKIRDEIISPIEKRLGVNLGFRKILCVKEKIPADSLKGLLTPLSEPQLTEKERLEYSLLWYDVEFLDTSDANIFNGVPAFVALLAGTAELVQRFSKGEDKAYICKFTHPDKSVNGNDFSYGVLIQAAGSMGISDYSGWILFFDCCGDYSGFAGSEHAMAEVMIAVYKKRGQIEVIEMTIDKSKFKKYIAERIVSRNQQKIQSALERESIERTRKEIVAEARGLITEFLTYYTLTKSEQGSVDWNIKQNKSQLDIILKTEDKTTLIECVYDPSNMNVDKEVKKLKAKLNDINTGKAKDCAFWFWSRPHPKTIERLVNGKIHFEVISESIMTNPVWTGKKLDKLKTIFQF